MKAPLLNEFNINSQILRESQQKRYHQKLDEIKYSHKTRENNKFLVNFN